MKASRLRPGVYINKETGTHWLKMSGVPPLAICNDCIEILRSGRLHDPFCSKCSRVNTEERRLTKERGIEAYLTKTNLPLKKL